MHTSHPRLRLRPWYWEAVHSRIWYPSQIESTRLWLRPWYSDALHPLLWLHPQIASTTDYQTFGSSHRYLDPTGTLGEWDLALPRRSEKISHGHKKYRRTWFDQLQCESISGQTWSGPRHGATPSLNPISATACRACCIIIWLRLRIASYPTRLSHLRTRLQFLYFPSYFIRFYQLKFSISNWWSTNNIINQRPIPDSKKFENPWPRQSIHARI